MLTMLYDAETLKPQLLISEDIKNGDVGKKFWVINGAWDGTFNDGNIVIHSMDDEDHIPSTVYKCYKFKSKPPEEYFELYESYYPKDFYDGVAYEPWFAHFRDLVAKGEINV